MYNPHWQRHRTSWWDWGRDIVQRLVEQDLYNVILAPHQRLAESDPQLPQILEEAARHPHVHSDLESFAMVDGSYTAAADIYLGDTSSQVIEFLARPRPCVFLNNKRADWRARDDYAMWQAGEVVESLADVLPRWSVRRSAMPGSRSRSDRSPTTGWARPAVPPHASWRTSWKPWRASLPRPAARAPARATSPRGPRSCNRPVAGLQQVIDTVLPHHPPVEFGTDLVEQAEVLERQIHLGALDIHDERVRPECQHGKDFRMVFCATSIEVPPSPPTEELL